MMSKEETIGTLDNAKHFTYGDEKFNDAFNSAINYLKETMWIPVTERLPEEDALYLVDTEEQPLVCPFEGGEFLIEGVLAWMPLPERYKVE